MHPMPMSHLSNGVYAVSLTPLDTDFGIDCAALAAHIRSLLESGCDGVVFMGTTGEANSFSTKERKPALDALIEEGIPPERLMVGTGCRAVPDTVTLHAPLARPRATGILMLPPFYYKNVHDEGVFAAFDRVLREPGTDGLQVHLYHFPQMSAVGFSRDLTARLLAAYPGVIVGMKDSSTDWAHLQSTLRAFPGFRVFAGTERYLSDILRAGGAGCITATANVTAPLAAAVFANPGAQLQTRLTAARAAIEAFPMIPALKALMAARSGRPGWRRVRPPQVPLAAHVERALLDRALPLLGDMPCAQPA